MEPPGNVPWVEKYRPARLEDLVTRGQVLETMKRLTTQSYFPHLLLFGPPGTGKTSAILAVANTLYGPNHQGKNVLELNASDDRGINVVRNQIQDCALSTSLIQSTASAVPFKLIVLDECDNMTKDAQMALRRVMEDFAANVRFCLMCNHPNRLLPAIRSRCAQIRFPLLDAEMMKNRLEHIIHSERVRIDSEGVKALIKTSKGDMRHVLNTLQFLHMTGKEISVKEVYEATGVPSDSEIEEILHHLLNSDCKTASQFITELCEQKGHALIDIVAEVASKLTERKALPDAVMIDLISEIGECEMRLTRSFDENMQLLGLIGSFIQARERVFGLAT